MLDFFMKENDRLLLLSGLIWVHIVCNIGYLKHKWMRERRTSNDWQQDMVIQYFETLLQRKVSLKVLNSGIVLKTFTHGMPMSEKGDLAIM